MANRFGSCAQKLMISPKTLEMALEHKNNATTKLFIAGEDIVYASSYAVTVAKHSPTACNPNMHAHHQAEIGATSSQFEAPSQPHLLMDALSASSTRHIRYAVGGIDPGTLRSEFSSTDPSNSWKVIISGCLEPCICLMLFESRWVLTGDIRSPEFTSNAFDDSSSKTIEL
ncbi:hypothetical protein OGAPHI_004856 [Ogataea philodendri]|uniref:Uncharacterized protein n=1 Tax=Ogataea philodendri TaxID=1378263 RepID=A0A9P8P2T4_9ASCO|nr:uncharacterized protein OGAPHI_004856 [Ogataea philodendri]KAH3664142.1 hypothetical protein OGAPHI_004856 [Ogataea philodendri]